jgi:hypothetical protein
MSDLQDEAFDRIDQIVSSLFSNKIDQEFLARF